jgi:hypothetical protein
LFRRKILGIQKGAERPPCPAARRFDESLMQALPMSMAGRIKSVRRKGEFLSRSTSFAPNTRVPVDGNRFCRTLAYPRRPNLLTPGCPPARLREVGTARHVMDEALAAQTIEQPCTPHGGFPYARCSFWNLQSMGLRWRSWVQSLCGESATSSLTQAIFRATRICSWWATTHNDSFASYIEV